MGGSARRVWSRARGVEPWLLALSFTAGLACDRRVEEFPDEGIGDEFSDDEHESGDHTSADTLIGEGDETGGSGGCMPVLPSLTIADGIDPGSVACVTEVEGDLIIGPTTELVDLSLLANLREVGGSIYVFGNLALESLAGLEQLEQVNWLHVRRNALLVDLEGFAALEQVSRITIANNDGLTSLAGLPEGLHPSLLELAGNDALLGVDGLPVLLPPSTGTPLHVEIEDHLQLADLDGLAACCSDQPIALLLARNPALESLAGLEQFERLDALRLHDNRGLASLVGVDASEIATFELIYSHCEEQSGPSIVDMHGLGKLVSVGVMKIESVPSLTSLDGFDSLNDISKLYVRNNAALPWTEAIDLVGQTGPVVFEGCGGVGGPTCALEPCPML